MNIGVDVDGVLVDLANYQLKYGEPYFLKKYNMKIVDPAGYDIEDIFNCTHKQRTQFWNKYIWGYCLTEPVYEGAAKVISDLHNDGHRIIIITGRAHTTEKSITGSLFRKMLVQWLKKRNIYYDNIIYCSEKESSAKKPIICRNENIDVMIDDKPENILALCDKIKVICYPAIWNENLTDDRLIRVNNWYEIYDRIREME